MKGKAKPRDIRIARITACSECPHLVAIDNNTFICEEGKPKFVVSENGNPPEIIPQTCPLPKEADRHG